MKITKLMSFELALQIATMLNISCNKKETAKVATPETSEYFLLRPEVVKHMDIHMM